jgi:hypothetical protein
MHTSFQSCGIANSIDIQIVQCAHGVPYNGNFRWCKILRNCLLLLLKETIAVLIFVPSPLVSRIAKTCQSYIWDVCSSLYDLWKSEGSMDLLTFP